MKPQIDYSLYLVTNQDLMSTSALSEAVEKAISGGCTVVQLREKTLSPKSFFEIAKTIRLLTAQMGIPLIINDRIDIALAVGADGVHVGQNDIPAVAVRKIIGPTRILGASTNTLEESLKAVEDGADYLGIGAMFATDTKTDALLTSMSELQRIRKVVSLPIVAIGGINEQTVPLLKGMGIDGLAVASAIIGKNDIAGAARNLKELFWENKL